MLKRRLRQPESKPQVADRPGSGTGDGPLLAVDVDGVISLFGFSEPLSEAPGEMKLIDGVVHCISTGAGERLRRLSEIYELVWATGWEDRANDHLPALLGLPGELPFLTFDGRAQFGTSHWKLDAIGEYAGERPLAWIDDCIDTACEDWARQRGAPTLLVPTEPDRGLEEDHVTTMLTWAKDGFQVR
jgi:HAD domain in Swiss Army Knife RNA repair proteins